MGDFNIAQFLGGILQGAGEGLGYKTPVIPRKKNAPPVIEMTPSQEAGQHIQEGVTAAMGQPILSSIEDVPGNTLRLPRRMPRRDMMFRLGDEYDDPKGMRQMRYGGVVQDGETVEVGEAGKELVTKTPDGRVIVTPQEEVIDVNQQYPIAPQPPAEISADVRAQMTNPQYSEREEVVVGRPTGRHKSPAQPPNMSLPEPINPGKNDEEYLQNELLNNMEVKPSPWKDLGAALIQAGNNYFNNKNEPIRTWGEVKRDAKVAPLAAKLALVRDAKKTRMDADTNAARLGLITEQAKTIGRDDALNIEKETRLKTKDENNVKMWERKLDQADVKLAQGSLKLAQDAELIKLRDKWALADDEISKRRLALVEQEMTNRMTRHDETMTERRLSREDLNKYRGASLQLRQAGSAAGLTPKQAQDIADRKTRLKAALIEKVRAGKMSQADMDEILNEEVDAGFGKASGDVDR